MTIEKVISGGYCIGCGVCRAIEPSIKIEFNEFGDLVANIADLENEMLKIADRVCPFSEAAPNEDELGTALFASQGFEWQEDIGYYHSLFATYSTSARSSGSSGGIVTWLLETLLQQGVVDRVIHVAPADLSDSDGRFFKFRVSDRIESIREGATSFYYPVSYDEVVSFIAQTPGRYAVTGVPCFQKALRQLRSESPIFEERIAVQIGIVCGQMKSAHYLAYLAKRAGVPRGEALVGACFRRKVDGQPANNYAFEANSISTEGRLMSRRIMNSDIGINWGMGYFKPLACDFCDDVFAETADVAAMDAWLPKYVQDSPGWSLVVLRNSLVAKLFGDATATGELVANPVTASEVSDSQRGGLNHRKGMLGYRLWLRRGLWHPRKRQNPRCDYPLVLRIEQRLRAFLRRKSRQSFLQCADGDANVFRKRMAIYEITYKILMRLKARISH